MAALRTNSSLERRLKEIEREKTELRTRLEDVRRWAATLPPERNEPRLRAPAIPQSMLQERAASEYPSDETTLEFAPGPDGLNVKHVVMPRLQRTDLLRPSIGAASSTSARVPEPQHDRFRNYFGTTGLKRVREARKEQSQYRNRATFMLIMVAVFGFILFKMIT